MCIGVYLICVHTHGFSIVFLGGGGGLEEDFPEELAWRPGLAILATFSFMPRQA